MVVCVEKAQGGFKQEPLSFTAFAHREKVGADSA